MIVDSQCHVSPLWFEPVETLLHQMDRNRVGQAVLVQLLGQFDNRYQQACVKNYPGRFASVVAVDPARPDAVEQLRRLADEGATAVRLRPGARSPGDDRLAIWRAAESCRLAVSCVGTSATFAAPEFAAAIAATPNVPIVLEHLAGASRPDADDSERAARLAALELARFPNVYLKVPGLGELIARPPALPEHGDSPFGPLPPLLRDALRRFGPDRLMWGSDFPVVASREGYANALRLCRNAFAGEPPAALDAIFGATAARVFKLAG